ncbi:MAG: YHS domain-containing (seleno)protein [Pseudomonadota bacterium]
MSTVGALMLAFVSLWSAPVHAQEGVQPAIEGYSPVSYFTEGAAEKGSSEYAVEHEGAVYFLTSREQMALFAQDPEKYRPRHKACPYSLAYGMVLPLDPTNFKIVGGSLLLFHRSEEKDALLEWNESELSEAELLRRADANVFLITF